MNIAPPSGANGSFGAEGYDDDSEADISEVDLEMGDGNAPPERYSGESPVSPRGGAGDCNASPGRFDAGLSPRAWGGALLEDTDEPAEAVCRPALVFLFSMPARQIALVQWQGARTDMT